MVDHRLRKISLAQFGKQSIPRTNLITVTFPLHFQINNIAAHSWDISAKLTTGSEWEQSQDWELNYISKMLTYHFREHEEGE
jgi:hypothetical protein